MDTTRAMKQPKIRNKTSRVIRRSFCLVVNCLMSTNLAEAPYGAIIRDGKRFVLISICYT